SGIFLDTATRPPPRSTRRSISLRFARWRPSIWRGWHDAARSNRAIHRLAASPWREVHDRGEPPVAIPWIRRRGCSLRCSHPGASSGLSGTADPSSREQVLRPCRLLAHAISRGHASCSPLPDNEPKSPVRAPPYIYSRDELRRLLDPTNVEISRRCAVQLDAATFRTLLLLLYGAGLRFSEATGLTLADVDLAEDVLNIRATKFYKSRLVPIGPQLATVLASYMPLRRRGGP